MQTHLTKLLAAVSFTWMHMYTPLYTYIKNIYHIYPLHIYMCVYTQKYTCIHVCIYVYTYTYAYILCIYMYIHKHQGAPLTAHRNLTQLDKPLLHLPMENGNPSFCEPVFLLITSLSIAFCGQLWLRCEHELRFPSGHAQAPGPACQGEM